MNRISSSNTHVHASATDFYNRHSFKPLLLTRLEAAELETQSSQDTKQSASTAHPQPNVSANESILYPNNLKHREFAKEATQNFCLEQATIVQRQGVNEDENSGLQPTQSKTDSSSCLGRKETSSDSKAFFSYQYPVQSTLITYSKTAELDKEASPSLSLHSEPYSNALESITLAPSDLIPDPNAFVDRQDPILQFITSPERVTPLKRKASEVFDNDTPLSPHRTPPRKYKKYTFAQSPGGTVRAELTPSRAKDTNIIYEIYNNITKKSYVGKTACQFQKRIKEHCFAVNHPKRAAAVHRAIKAHANHFSFGILYQAQEGDDLNKLEKQFIRARSSLGYNQNAGGGGGTTRPTSQVLVKRATINQATPPKYYPFSEKKTGFLLSPGAKKEKRIIYVIKDQLNHRRYVGKTEQILSRRVNQHNTAIRQAGKEQRTQPPTVEEGQTKPTLYQEILKRPNDFFIGILVKAEENEDIDHLEKIAIKEKDSLGANGFNRKNGGGGTHADC